VLVLSKQFASSSGVEWSGVGVATMLECLRVWCGLGFVFVFVFVWLCVVSPLFD
jgi:di/tricarboxylate transporter